MNRAASHLISREEPQKLYGMAGVFRQKLGGTRKLLKTKSKDCFRRAYLPLKEGRGLIRQIALATFGGWRRAYLTDYLIGADQKIRTDQVR